MYLNNFYRHFIDVTINGKVDKEQLTSVITY